MTRFVFPVVALLAASAVAAPVPKALKKTDAQLLEGRWVCVSDDTWWMVIKDGKMSSGIDTPETPPDTPFTLDESRFPKHLDVAWKTWKTGVAPYIYKLEGDTLTKCHAQPGQPRPTEFKSGGPGGQYCIVYKRVSADFEFRQSGKK